MKINTITWGTIPRLPGLRPSDTGRIDCDKPGVALSGWRLALRGTQAYFISPPGWNRDQQTKVDPKGPTTVFGPIAIGDIYIEWQLDSGDKSDLDKLLAGKLTFDSPPFGWQPEPIAAETPSILAKIPAGQMGDA